MDCVIYLPLIFLIKLVQPISFLFFFALLFQVYSSMEHLSQHEQKTSGVTKRDQSNKHKDDRLSKRESLGSFTLRDKSWRTSSPEM